MFSLSRLPHKNLDFDFPSYEHLWDEIARTHEVEILCGYVLNCFQRGQESPIFERICAEHSSVSS